MAKQNYTPSVGRRGVFAPRRNTPRTMVFPPSGTDWRQQNPDYGTTRRSTPTTDIGSIVAAAESYVDPRTRASEEDTANWILAGLDEANPPPVRRGGGGGGGNNAYTRAIKILQKQLSGGEYGTSFDNLSAMLGTTSGTARGQIDQATADAIAQINSRNAFSTPINYSAGTTQIPQTALNTYLNSIGASTGGVDAGRNFLQGLIDTSAQGASQSMAADQQAYAAQRQAAIDALTGNQQYQQGNLATSTQAQMLAIASAKEKERKAISDQILQLILRGGIA
jgi:hypothetical protein